MVTILLFQNLRNDAPPLLVIVLRADDLDALADALFRTNLFLNLLLITQNHLVRRLHNVGRRAVVLFQLEGLNVVLRKVFLEVQNVLNRRTAKGVDRLGIVAHHADVPRARIVDRTVGFPVVEHLFDDGVLQGVRILKLIHEDVAELLLVLFADLLVVLQQFVQAEQ